PQGCAPPVSAPKMKTCQGGAIDIFVLADPAKRLYDDRTVQSSHRTTSGQPPLPFRGSLMTHLTTLMAALPLDGGCAAEIMKAGKALGVRCGTERFGARLATIRQQRGLSQEALAAQVHVSRRVIAYYEAESTQPPGALLTALARTLKVSADELLGLRPISD